MKAESSGSRRKPDGRAEGHRSGHRAQPASHRQHGSRRGRRTLVVSLASAFLILGISAATGIAWDPFSVSGGSKAQAPQIGQPWSVTPSGRTPATRSEPPTTIPSATALARPTPAPVEPPTTPGGGMATDPKPASAALPFDMPSAKTLRGSRRLVFAHYFTPYPLSLDNEPSERDYYTRNYLQPGGESGKHERYGGLLRDRPLPVAPKSGDWELANLREEVRTARAAGIDGFSLDLLSLTGKNWERSNELLDAAASVDPAFKVMLMPDMTSLRADPVALADALARLAAKPAAHRLSDGRLVVSPFKAEAQDVGWWKQMLDRMRQQHRIEVAFVPLFLDYGSHSGEFSPISYGFSDWGSRSYTGQEGGTSDARRAHSAGKIWMQPVSVQDARPNQGIYDEAGNTSTLRSSWKHAIDGGADWVQLTTWNDYSEGSHFAPSLHNGYAYLDLTSYYLSRFKTGKWPKVVRDTVYLSSRTQFAHATPVGAQDLVMRPREGTATPRDKVEVLSFLTAPATLRTTTGQVKSSHRAPAGLHAELLPLRTGTSSAQSERQGRVTARVELRYPVRDSVKVQDLQYYAATSGR
ncbi:endo-1,3-alpha-glucanase family glycosylhydrolase [Streptomyces sp. NPDC006879]|uniref:endo-1,3-alpha-glucanase family glycosylhydrolase n=1 Tax=Streptomyces sp. NPDC006879 TaxID=3364767 RepID=UPI0036994FEB